MAQVNFAPPGPSVAGSLGQSIQQLLMERAAKQRQAMLDEIMQRQAESQMAVHQQNIAASQADVTQGNRRLDLETSGQTFNQGRQTQQDTYNTNQDVLERFDKNTDRTYRQGRDVVDDAQTKTENKRADKKIDADISEAAARLGISKEQLKLEWAALGIRDRDSKAKSSPEDTAEGRRTTMTALNLANRLQQHPGMQKATGAYELRGLSQEATDFNSMRDQLIATLTLPNLGLLKGPMSDKDVVFVKQLATRLANTRMSEAETRRALTEATAFLQQKLNEGNGPAIGGGNSGGPPSGGGEETPEQRYQRLTGGR